MAVESDELPSVDLPFESSFCSYVTSLHQFCMRSDIARAEYIYEKDNDAKYAATVWYLGRYVTAKHGDATKKKAAQRAAYMALQNLGYLLEDEPFLWPLPSYMPEIHLPRAAKFNSYASSLQMFADKLGLRKPVYSIMDVGDGILATVDYEWGKATGETVQESHKVAMQHAAFAALKCLGYFVRTAEFSLQPHEEDYGPNSSFQVKSATSEIAEVVSANLFPNDEVLANCYEFDHAYADKEEVESNSKSLKRKRSDIAHACDFYSSKFVNSWLIDEMDHHLISETATDCVGFRDAFSMYDDILYWPLWTKEFGQKRWNVIPKASFYSPEHYVTHRLNSRKHHLVHALTKHVIVDEIALDNHIFKYDALNDIWECTLEESVEVAKTVDQLRDQVRKTHKKQVAAVCYCSICKVVIGNNIDKLLFHLVDDHSVDKQEAEEAPIKWVLISREDAFHVDPQMRHKCEEAGCTESFVSKDILLEHQTLAHAVKCPTCGCIVMTRTALYQHSRSCRLPSRHTQVSGSEKDDLEFKAMKQALAGKQTDFIVPLPAPPVQHVVVDNNSNIADESNKQPLLSIVDSLQVFRVNDQGKFICNMDICGEEFVNGTNLHEHLSGQHHVRVQLHQCEMCSQVFHYVHDVYWHIKKSHQQKFLEFGYPYIKFARCLVGPRLILQPKSATYPCFFPGCNSTFATVSHIGKHVTSEHTLKCDICETDTFEHQLALDTHMITHHHWRKSTISASCSIENILQGNGCSNKFSIDMNRSLAFPPSWPFVLTDNGSIICKIDGCNEEWQSGHYFYKHAARKHKLVITAYKCPFCEQLFDFQQIVQSHILKDHAGLRHDFWITLVDAVCGPRKVFVIDGLSFPCLGDECEEQFADLNRYTKHTGRCHGVKCEYCGKKVAVMGAMATHLLYCKESKRLQEPAEKKSP